MYRRLQTTKKSSALFLLPHRQSLQGPKSIFIVRGERSTVHQLCVNSKRQFSSKHVFDQETSKEKKTPLTFYYYTRDCFRFQRDSGPAGKGLRNDLARCPGGRGKISLLHSPRNGTDRPFQIRHICEPSWLPIRTSRIRSMIQPSANDLTLVSANTNSQFFISPRLPWQDILPAIK